MKAIEANLVVVNIKLEQEPDDMGINEKAEILIAISLTKTVCNKTEYYNILKMKHFKHLSIYSGGSHVAIHLNRTGDVRALIVTFE